MRRGMCILSARTGADASGITAEQGQRFGLRSAEENGGWRAMSSERAQTDYFAVLGIPRRPWVESEALKERFRNITVSSHPDLGGNEEQFALATTAHRTLQQPSLRLRHLLDLELPQGSQGGNGATEIPEALAERFLNIATLRREVDAFVNQEAKTTTPVARAVLASERFMMQRDVRTALGEVEGWYEDRLHAIKEIDETWETARAEAIPRLAALQQELAYLEKWAKQLRDLLPRLEA